MSTISSVGLGSGLDVNSIVSQLVALEKAPLTTLGLRATTTKAQISAFGDIQSQFASLTDVATRIASASTWSGRNATSSNTSAATITATSSAGAATFSLDVDQLAQPQSISSGQLTTGAPVGAGTLTLRLGTWTGSSFAPATGTVAAPVADVDVSISATDTVADIATKINSAGAGVVATAFNDGTSDRLLLRSKNTGAEMGFRAQSSDAALAGLVFDPENKPAVGMASTGLPVQYGQDAKARINGLAVTSSSNTLASTIPGVTVKLLATTTTNYGSLVAPLEVKAPVSMVISEDVTPAVKNVNDFVTAYNTLNKSLTDLTRYVASTKTAGLFQGDSTIVGMQNILRAMASSSSLGATSQRLSDVGLERKLDGSLTINTTKLSTAANDGTSLQKLFTSDNGNAQTNGFALKFRDFGKAVAASGGSVQSKAAALQKNLDLNTAAQTKVTDHATLFEARLRKQYSALDNRMASLNALNAYMTQQVATWNKSTG